MSTRWYPIYQRGSPQLRIFLPNFWMKLIKPTVDQPSNLVNFACSMEMTRFDMKNYLEKIYNVKPIHIRTRIASGKCRRDPGKGYIVKNDDIKYAYVTLPRGEVFEFPDIFPNIKEQEKEYEKTLKQSKQVFDQFLEKNKERREMPGWFTF
ncbi:hypothetical protein ABEB36_005727 [Hypothenemus hampei]|uniref:Large ribosomal subunit protein uL23m n=1 Tax=Hypothenemus hampei TaxID=57062 RepID=A0ABD1F0G0_HYPHA